MRIIKLYLPFELFDRIKLMARFYDLSISKMMKELLEIGYIEMLKNHNYKDNDQEVLKVNYDNYIKIPIVFLSDVNVSSNAKLLYGLLVLLTYQQGYC